MLIIIIYKQSNHNCDSLTKQMNEIMGVLLPSQQAKYLLWVEDNKACMYMLNSLWNTMQ